MYKIITNAYYVLNLIILIKLIYLKMKIFSKLLKTSKFSLSSNFVFFSLSNQSQSLFRIFNIYRQFSTNSSEGNTQNDSSPKEPKSCGNHQCGCSSASHTHQHEDPLEKELKLKNYKIIECINLGKFDDALELSEDFINLITTNFGKQHPFYCSALNNKAFILKTCGQFDEANALFEEVIEKYKKIYGENNEKVVISMHNLATSLKEAKEYEKSLEIYEKLLNTIRNDYIHIEGEKTGKLRLNIIANIYNSAGGLYRQLKNYEESNKLFADAMKIIQENFGHKTLPMATVLNNVALNLKDQGRFEEAMDNYNKALEIRKDLLDENHPEVIMLRNNIDRLKAEMEENKNI
jgi:tetratricopeptide (TPR) repeat protein